MLISSSAPNTFSSADPGFPALAVDELLAAHADIIARIKLCHGADRESFETEVLTLIRRYAAYVHLLPATADNYFNAPGGLLRLGLEVGFFSLQGTDAHIFSGRSTITTRRLLEPRWRHATFIAGLCCELHRVLSHLKVTDADGQPWSPYLQPLSDWLKARGTTRYFVSWRPQAIETRGLSVFALPHVVSPAVLHYLAEDNVSIVPLLMASIGGMPAYRERNVLDELVRRSLALVIDRQLMANADRHGSTQLGSHLERYLVDGLRRLVNGHSAWTCNHEKSRIWFGQDGLFLLWPSAAQDLCKQLEADQLPGVPRAAQTLLEVLLTAQVFEPDAEHSTWFIQPPGAKSVQEAVKLRSPTILFDNVDSLPTALDLKLVRGCAEPAPLPPHSPPAAPPQRPTQAGEQMSLLPTLSPGVENIDQAPTLPAQTPTPVASPAAVTFTLQAPMRLNPVVREVLAAVVHTLNDDAGPARGCSIAQGLFVPLAEFERRGVQPSMAMRALAELRMLVTTQADGPPTLTRDFRDTPTIGLVVDPRFIGGFDLAAFALQDG